MCVEKSYIVRDDGVLFWCVTTDRHHAIAARHGISQGDFDSGRYSFAERPIGEVFCWDDVTQPWHAAVLHGVQRETAWIERHVKTARDAYDAVDKPAWDAYDAAVKPAWDAYCAAVKPAWDAYDAAVKPAWDAYDAASKPARDAYDAAVKTARDAYDAASKPARDAYDAAVKEWLLDYRRKFPNSAVLE